jgi:hypothetical protein
MIKMLKKIILLSLLITNLFKKLTVGLTLFLYNRTFGTRTGVIMGVAGLAMLVVVSTFIFMPKNLATGDAENARMVATQVPAKKEISFNAAEITEEMNDTQAFELEITDDYISQSSGTVTIDEIERHLQSIDAISYQATEFNMGGSVGRSEPFMPARPLSPMDNIMGGDPLDPAGLSPEELARQEAEQRRNEIRDRIHSDISVKGIVLSSDHSDPMAILEVTRSDGTVKVGTFKEGDVVNLTSVQGTISEISDYVIKISAEDVTEEKHLPQFEDEELNIVPVADSGAGREVDSQPQGDLMPPPTPGKFPPPPGVKSTTPSSIGDAKKKIEEIDKLLDSF